MLESQPGKERRVHATACRIRSICRLKSVFLLGDKLKLELQRAVLYSTLNAQPSTLNAVKNTYHPFVAKSL
jgi:hypothetical protein